MTQTLGWRQQSRLPSLCIYMNMQDIKLMLTNEMHQRVPGYDWNEETGWSQVRSVRVYRVDRLDKMQINVCTYLHFQPYHNCKTNVHSH